MVIVMADHGNDMDWCHVMVACGCNWRKCQWLLCLLSCVVLKAPSVVIVVIVPLCCCVLNVIAFSLSNVVFCHSAVFGIVPCSSTSVTCICRLFSFVLSFDLVVSFAEYFISFVASSEWISEADRTVVVIVESFSSILSFSFVVGVVINCCIRSRCILRSLCLCSFLFPFPLYLLYSPFPLWIASMSMGACPPPKLVATLDDCDRSCCSLPNAVVDL